MNQDSLGAVGGLAADRPILSNLVLSFGLTALAAIAADGAGASGLGRRLADVVFAAFALGAAPLAFSAVAPDRLRPRLGFALAIVALAFAFLVLRPVAFLAPTAGAAAQIAAGACLAAAYVAFRPVLGAPAQLGLVSVFAAILGALGGAALFMMQEAAPDARTGAAIAVAIAVGSATGLFAISEFAADFARGTARRDAAGRAAQDGATSVIFAGAVSAAAFAFVGMSGETVWPHEALLAGAAAVLAAGVSLIATAGALTLRRPNEAFAAAENRRREAFRRFWRPIRNNLPPSSAYAAVAVAGIAVAAAAFGAEQAPPLGHIVYVMAAGALAGLVFFSLRVGVFVFFLLLSADYFAFVANSVLGGPAAGPAEHGGALACAGFAYGQLAVSWREARSPRLNARETTEAAMSAAAGPYILSGAVALAAFHAAALSGLWSGGAVAAARAGILLVFGAVFAPALMTALSGVVRRELA